jgi:hypothetical protein
VIHSSRPIVWGLLGFIGGGVFWLIMSLVAESQRLAGQVVTASPFVLLSSYVFFFSLPVNIVAELALWWNQRPVKKT